MKRFCVLSTVLVTLAAPTLLGDGAEHQVLQVPGDFATIQQAVDAAKPGDIISVAAGTYCERLNITTADVRLRAAPAVGDARVVLSGACGTGGFGIHVAGVSGVEISGFTVEGFSSGIVLHHATGALLHKNEIRGNVHVGPSLPGATNAQGILLIGSSFNDIAQNWIHDNGHLGIGLWNGSNGNLIRANRLTDNQAQQSTYPGFGCTVMLWGTTTNSGNRIVENEVTGSVGYGIMIGGGVQTGNLVAQNRVHGHSWPGIVVMTNSTGNDIQQNDARGNGTEGWTDLWDYNPTVVNRWQRNLGTCTPGNAGCE